MNIRMYVLLNKQSDRPIFERIFSFDSSIKFPFEEIVHTQKVLFGIQCIVNFEIV